MTSDFTNQKRRIATEKDTKASWGRVSRGRTFRCHLCGEKFKVGDGWRWVYSPKTGNFFVCDSCDNCDNGDIREKYKERKENFIIFCTGSGYFQFNIQSKK